MPTSKTVKSPKSTPKSVKQSKNTTRPKTTSKSVKPTSKSVQNKKKGGVGNTNPKDNILQQIFIEKINADDEIYKLKSELFDAKINNPTTIKHAFENIATGIKQLQTQHTNIQQNARAFENVRKWFNSDGRLYNSKFSGEVIQKIKDLKDISFNGSVNSTDRYFSFFEDFESNVDFVSKKMSALENENNELNQKINELNQKINDKNKSVFSRFTGK